MLRTRIAICLSASLCLLVPAAAIAAVLGHWSRSQPLLRARAWETATVMGGGDVLVTGGFGTVGPNEIGPMASAEIYSLRTHRWSPAPAILAPRFEHTATALEDGTVLIAGGANETAGTLASAERYDPVRGQWMNVPSMRSARVDATATLLLNGRVLLTGGLGRGGEALRSAELYDPLHNRWLPAASMHVARYHQTATLLRDGRVLVVGGEHDVGGSKILYRSAEIYDPVRNRWTYTGAMHVPRANHVAVRLEDGEVLVAGGGELGIYGAGAEIYNPRSGRWRPAAAMHAKRAFATATLLGNGQVLVAGGFSGQTDVATAERYDPKRNRWLPAGSFDPGRGHQAAVLLPGGHVMVIGGQRYNGPFLRSVETYQP